MQSWRAPWEDAEASRELGRVRKGLFVPVLLGLAVPSLFAGLVLGVDWLWRGPRYQPGMWVTLAVQPLYLLAYFLFLKERAKAAYWVMVLSFFASMTILLLFHGTAHVVTVGYAIVVLVAAMFLGSWRALGLSTVAAVVYFLASWMEKREYIPWPIAYAEVPILNGVGLWVALVLLVICDDWIYSREIYRRLSQQRLLARGLQKAKEELERRVAHRTAELSALNRQLRRDIAAREKAEQALCEAEQRYRAIFETTGTGMVILDKEGIITLANEEFARMAGYPREEIEGQLSWRQFVHPEDLAKMGEYRQLRLLDPKLAPRSYEFRFLKRQGEVLHALATVSMNPETKEAVVSVIDISERKRIEEQLRQALKMEAVGRLAGGLAHDFNNLLTVINGSAQLILADVPSSTPWRQELEDIYQAGLRAARLVRQLLTFSRQRSREVQVINLNKVLEETSKMLQRLLGEDVALDMRLAPDLGYIRADPNQLEQVIANLAVNARDAMPEGGLLTFETANVPAQQVLLEELAPSVEGRGYVLLSVRDTGIGMSDEVKAHLFEPFFTTKEPGKGTGLGLAMVYGLVRQCGGRIEVESEPGQGSTFRLYFPRVEAPEHVEEDPEEAEALPKGREMVLLVEDQDEVRRLTARMLQALGYEVVALSSAEEALRFCDEEEYPLVDLLLTDVIMPEMSGPDLFAQLRQHYPYIRPLFMSGYLGRRAVERVLDQPGMTLLKKPFSLEGLAHAVRQALDGAREAGLES
ncbi:MAG: PAS domain S-box protein [Anaerolineae bacterium]|nr:PAS domain S-box protein [Anaerolineae bacterium]